MRKIINILMILIIILETTLLFLFLLQDKRDVNNDGNIDIKDMLIIQKYILDSSKESDN